MTTPTGGRRSAGQQARAALSLVPAAAAAWLWSATAAAQTPPAPVDWTAVLFMDGTYDNMEEKLSWTGSSSRVHVLVLHQGWDGLRAYRMEPDPDGTHPPGECCPGEIQPCCASTDLSLAAMGLSSSSWITEPGTISAFLSYVADHYPAHRYLMSFRGSLDFSGMSAPGMVAEVREFVEVHRSGARIDVMNLGYCLSGSIRWAYDLREVVEILFASGNFTNPPVAARWRFYAWVRQLIKDPTTTAEELAALMPDVFAETTQACIDAGHDCENPGEPWAVGAWRLASFGDLAEELRSFNCSLLQSFGDTEAAVDDALQDAAVYGFGLADFSCYLQRLRLQLGDPTLAAAAERVQGVLDGALVHARQEETPYYTCPEVAGLNVYWDSWDPYADGGDFALDSGWGMLIDATQGGSTTPTVDGVRIVPAELTLRVGENAKVEALALDENGAAMCHATVDWDTAGIVHIGSLSNRDNPTTFEAAVPGVGMLRARVSGRYGETLITVLAGDGTPPPSIYRPTLVEEGCGCAGSPASALGLLVLPVVLRRRRQRQPRGDAVTDRRAAANAGGPAIAAGGAAAEAAQGGWSRGWVG